MIGQISLRNDALGLFNINISQTVQTSHLTIIHKVLSTHMAMHTLSFSQSMPSAHRKHAIDIISANDFINIILNT